MCLIFINFMLCTVIIHNTGKHWFGAVNGDWMISARCHYQLTKHSNSKLQMSACLLAYYYMYIQSVSNANTAFRYIHCILLLHNNFTLSLSQHPSISVHKSASVMITLWPLHSPSSNATSTPTQHNTILLDHNDGKYTILW